ncbi:ribonuclease H [Senna tora]|uniref:Ribonuclease H n=1 Tax=Senna tora TaxID=362788 RepID=A0A834W5H6_9FABA|nr:ribonuclease H [Senna tora]
MKENWLGDEHWNFNIAMFTERVRKWNVDGFGHIGKWKRELLARLDGIQKSHNLSHNPFLERLESDLHNQLTEVLKQEEVLWYQKLWGQWLREGDRNTRNRLARWKRNCLSLAGQVTLAKSVISDVPYYAMQSTRIPQVTCSEVESYNVLRGKYGRGVNWIKRFEAKNQDLILWKNIAKLGPSVQIQQRWNVANGTKVAFWKDVWGNHGAPILQQASVIHSENIVNRSVASYGSDSGGGWKEWELELFLDQDSINKVLSEMPPNPVRGSDKLCWGVVELEGHGSVENKVVSVASSSLAIGYKLEDCHHAVKMWKELVHPSKMALFYSTYFNAWINLSWGSNLSKFEGVDWTQIWSMGMWMLWYWRNKAFFEEGFSRPSNAHLRVMDYVKEVNNAIDIFDMSRDQVNRQEVLVAWEKSSEGWIKINFDGAVKTSEGKTEAWGAFEGIKLARDMGYKKIILESDSKCLINSIMFGSNNIMEVSSIIQEILLMLKDFDDVRLQHRWRESNSCADFLANLGTSSPSVRCILHYPPSGMDALMLADVIGIQVPRVISS